MPKQVSTLRKGSDVLTPDSETPAHPASPREERPYQRPSSRQLGPKVLALSCSSAHSWARGLSHRPPQDTRTHTHKEHLSTFA